jgi:phosphocarrier protein
MGEIKMEKLEKIIYQLILCGGNARAEAYLALDAAEAYDFERAEEHLHRAEHQLALGHPYQRELIQLPIIKEGPLFLLIHAQDHLMTSQAELSLIKRVIANYRFLQQVNHRLNQLEKQKGVLNMAEKTVKIINPSGLHARPASLLVKEASNFKSTIKLVKNNKEVDAKSLLGVMSLAAKNNETLTIRAEGEDAEAAVEKLAAFIGNLSE